MGKETTDEWLDVHMLSRILPEVLIYKIPNVVFNFFVFFTGLERSQF